jgi:hypothetical protein
MEIAISPLSSNLNTPLPHDFETKVRLFWERFHGWKFEIAQKMLDGFTDGGGVAHPGIPHAGYAAMDVMFSYFEPLGKHIDGYLDPGGNRKSGHYFKEGVKNVFDFSGLDPADVDKLLGVLWSGIRCGLYHTGNTKNKVLISGGTTDAIRFATQDEIVIVNPHLLAEALIWHVADYRDRLLAAGEASSRGSNLIARYDFDNPLNP